MASEAKRGFTRIASNYTRLVTNVIMGLALTPILLEATGEDGYAVIALLGATIGLASMVEEITRSSLIREMGHAYHRGDPEQFRRVYNSALAISSTIALITAAIFAAIVVAVPVLKIPAELVPAARWLVFTRGLETVLILVLAAPFNMYKVTERMAAFNAWQITGRAGYLLAAIWVLWTFDSADIGARITAFAISSSAFFMVNLLLAVGLIMRLEAGLWPAPRLIQRDAIRTILRIGGLNAAASTATNLHRRLAPILMNFAIGLGGNLILGLAIQVTVSVRRLTMGMTGGLDAVSARLSTARGDEAVRSLWHHSTRLHGVAAFGVAVAVMILAEPLLNLWLGKRIDDSLTTIPLAAALVRIMTIGMIARAISDGWINILYGAGHVGRYAWLVLAGGPLNPILFGALLVVFPQRFDYTAVCWAYSAVFVGIHAIVVPWRGAAALGARFRDFYRPLLRPLLVGLGCAPILLVANVPWQEWTLLRLAVAGGLYGVAYALGCILFVMHGHERLRFAKAALRRLPRMAPKRPQAP